MTAGIDRDRFLVADFSCPFKWNAIATPRQDFNESGKRIEAVKGS